MPKWDTFQGGFPNAKGKNRQSNNFDTRSNF